MDTKAFYRVLMVGAMPLAVLKTVVRERNGMTTPVAVKSSYSI